MHKTDMDLIKEIANYFKVDNPNLMNSIKEKGFEKTMDSIIKVKKEYKFDITILGGLGHVGLPLGIVFAQKGFNVCLLDLDDKKAEQVRMGKMPFIEYGAEPILKEVLEKKRLNISKDPSEIAYSKNIIVAIGTPIDEYLNPKTREFLETLSSFKPYLNSDQTIIIRSTIYPNTCNQIYNHFKNQGMELNISYCPERIVQGYSVKELGELPQIVAGLNERAIKNATDLFGKISPLIINTSMKEAELVKLFSNAWRYIQFATTNQFYMIANKFGADYDKVRHALTKSYGRAANLPGPGFAAGPCLLKDTMQLAAFNSHNFLLGHAAMMINEGLPNFIVDNLKKRHDISKKKIGILGMAFKADIDDIRDSLSYKLGKILRFHGTKVYYSDEFAKNPDFVTKEELVNNSEIIIVGVPHSSYKDLCIPKNKELVDLWGIVKKAQ